MAFCKIMFIGNLGRDPEMRYTPNGKPVTQFSVAVSHSKPDGQGGWVDEGTDWFRVSVFGEGRFKSREFEGKDGEKRTSLDVISDNVISLQARGQNDDGGTFTGAPVAAGAASGGGGGFSGGGGGGGSRPPADDTDLDDLPF